MKTLIFLEQDEEADAVGLICSDFPKGKGEVLLAALEACGGYADLIASPNNSTLSPELVAIFGDCGSVAKARTEAARLRALQISIITIGSTLYPRPLYEIHDPPAVLFVRGNAALLSDTAPAIAVVGARKADHLSCELAREFSAALAKSGASIVSGLAYGVDSAAHNGAVSIPHGKTIAVLGNGLEYGIYPSANAALGNRILDNGGALVSQFPPLMKPFPANFLNRNRVISGMSSATIIIQAARKSGALATARHALEGGKDVLVVPGAARDERFTGSNELIRQGAYLVSTVEHVFSHFPDLMPPKRDGGSTEQLNAIQREVLSQLGAEPLHIDELRCDEGRVGEYANALFELENLGLIVRLPGNMIAARLCSS